LRAVLLLERQNQESPRSGERCDSAFGGENHIIAGKTIRVEGGTGENFVISIVERREGKAF